MMMVDRLFIIYISFNWRRKIEGFLMVVEKVIPDNIELINLFGINDNNLKYI